MINMLAIIVLCVLIVASLFDWKWRLIPSIFLTGTLFLVLFLRASNLQFGVLGLVFALLIKDLIAISGKEFGIADIKIMVIISLFISTIHIFVQFMIIFIVAQFVYTILWKKILKRTDEMPFVPCLTIVYVIISVVGGVF